MPILRKSMPETLRVAAFELGGKRLFCRATIKPGGKRGVVGNSIQGGEGLDKNISGLGSPRRLHLSWR
jgi:hypothetical protein